MSAPGSTRWTLIRDAAGGDSSARSEFARLYEPAVRAYLQARWNRPASSSDVDDAAQEVFVDCFRDGGVLLRADPDRPGGFRAYLYGVVRNVARRFEKDRRQTPGNADLDAIEADEETLSRVFDRSWATLILKETARHQRATAREKGEDAVRRVDLLALRFEEDLPIREIAKLWEVEPDWLHHQYAQAREEFKRALREVVRAHHGDRDGAPVEEECRRLLEHLA